MPPMITAPWYTPLLDLQSKGSQVEVIGGLAGTHAARQIHQGQFFTPPEIVHLMWRIAGLDNNDHHGLTLVDNSFGSGRMFQFADPEQHHLHGVESDVALAEQVRTVVAEAGFTHTLLTGAMQEHHHSGNRFDVALINPPFSLHFDSPMLFRYPSNSYGQFGPQSSATSHVYAVEQAIDWASHVVALVPQSMVDALPPSLARYLIATYLLPRRSFSGEGAEVDVCILALGRDGEPPQTHRLQSVHDAVTPAFRIVRHWGSGAGGHIQHVVDESGQARVTLPVTGNKVVRVCHNGRKVILKFECAIAQARVMNMLLVKGANVRREKQKRPPKNLQYTGQGTLDLENHLLQDDPVASFRDRIVTRIAELGFEVQVDPGIERYLRRRIRRDAIVRTPLRHVVKLHDNGFIDWLVKQDTVTGVAKVQTTTQEDSPWGRGSYFYTPRSIYPGDSIEFHRRDDEVGKKEKRFWSYTHQQYHSSITETALLEKFQFPDFTPLPNDWTVIHEGLAAAFPAEYAQVRTQALALKLDTWCSWDYQFDDLCEMVLQGGNTIAGWDMGLGKARLALALCMMGGQHNLITVEPHLVNEMLTEIATLGIPKTLWQVLVNPKQAAALRKINIVSYSKLKSPVRAGSKRLFASLLRRRIHTHICDEAHLLRNPTTLQSRAVGLISAKRRYATTGTPIANYPRDILPLIQWVAGDGTATQPYGNHHAFAERANVADMDNSQRGIDVFREYFVTMEWVTNEFADEMQSGAKREIPRIANVGKFRSLVAPFIKRRIMEEPDVAKYVKVRPPVHLVVPIEWDRDHLLHYYQTAKEFVDWFKELSQYQQKNVGLIAILAKLQAVVTAANQPQSPLSKPRPYHPMTSKQRYTIQRLRELTTAGHKTILFCHSPQTVEYLSRHLQDIPHVLMHGGISIANRIKALDKEFRFGNSPLMLATKHTLQTGYNIHQADRVIHYDRTWTPKTEQQASARVLRPQQTKQVVIEYLHLAGSIDEYQAQMVSMKAEATGAGLDYGAEDLTRDFVHLETILGRFIADFEARLQISVDDLVKQRRPYANIVA